MNPSDYEYIRGECVYPDGSRLSPAELVLLSAGGENDEDRDMIMHVRKVFEGELIVDEDGWFPFESYDEELDTLAQEFKIEKSFDNHPSL